LTGDSLRRSSIMRLSGALFVGVALSACSMGNMLGGGTAPSAQTQQLQTASLSPAQLAAQSPALPAIATECPAIKVRPGAEALYYYGKGQIGNSKDLQYQAVIDKQSRNCVVSNGLITVQMGVVGRFLLGPAGSQSAAELPVRFAVEQGDATLFSEVYRVPVSLSAGSQSTDFVKVVENVAIPYVVGDEIVIWVGFDSKA
jgi:hypothetical protein